MPKAQTLQIKIQGDLAKVLQTNNEVKKIGVSEFVLRAIRFYLSRTENEDMEIRRKYQKGYGSADLTNLTLEMKDWEDEQVWPQP